MKAFRARTVNIQTSFHSTMQIMFAVSVIASGKMLHILVFTKKGERAKRKITIFPIIDMYCVQDKVWMDKIIIQKWINKVLRLYVETAPVEVHNF